MSEPAIRVQDLGKTFRQGFWRKRVVALQGVSFRVEPGLIFGFLGPNGAGKTTTIKILTGLISPTDGRAAIFGRPIPCPDVMSRVGFLPENPYVYPYLTPREFVEMCGQLSGMSGKPLHRRAAAILERVGILYAADRQIRRLSKGMLQRACLGAALVSEPDLLVLDEPMSGLDPVGRMQVRDVILEERDRGRTVFFSSHILSDVETMCDRVVILREGKVVVEGHIGELLRAEVLRTDLVIRGETAACERFRQSAGKLEGVRCAAASHEVRVEVEGERRVPEVLRIALDAGVQVAELAPRRVTLEDLFVERAIGRGD
jgi:ABC-2 type transport system ATP-binding protein